MSDRGSKTLTRRQLLHSIALATGAVAVVPWLQGCAGGPQPAATPAAKGGAPTTSPATSPAPTAVAGATGGTITVALNSQPPHLDVQTFVMRVTLWVCDGLHEYLCVYGPDLKIVPSLAKKWDVIDEKTVNFELNQGVKFHNGRELVAEDVKKNFERVIDPKTGSQLRGQMGGNVAGVEAKGKYNAIFHMNKPFAFLFDKLVHMPILPLEEVEAGKDPKTQPIGAGPFKFKEWRKDEYVELVRFPDYYRKGYPKIDRLIFKFVPDYGAARSTFLAKSADVLREVSGADIEPLKATPDVQLQSRLIAGYYHLDFNTKKAPWDNLKVRQAVKFAVNRQALIDGVLQGHGRPAFASIPANSLNYTPEVEYKQDTARAKQLLAEAGFPNGLDDSLIAGTGTVPSLTADILQSQLKDVGIRLKIEKMDSATLSDRVDTKKDHSLAIQTYNGADITRLLDPYLRPDGPFNNMSYNNPKLTALLDKGLQTMDEKERAKTYQEVAKVVAEDVPLLNLFSPILWTAAYNWVQGLSLSPNLQESWTEATTTRKQ